MGCTPQPFPANLRRIRHFPAPVPPARHPKDKSRFPLMEPGFYVAFPPRFERGVFAWEVKNNKSMICFSQQVDFAIGGKVARIGNNCHDDVLPHANIPFCLTSQRDDGFNKRRNKHETRISFRTPGSKPPQACGLKSISLIDTSGNNECPVSNGAIKGGAFTCFRISCSNAHLQSRDKTFRIARSSSHLSICRTCFYPSRYTPRTIWLRVSLWVTEHTLLLSSLSLLLCCEFSCVVYVIIIGT